MGDRIVCFRSAYLATEEERRKAFRAKWEELIDSGKLGYMALLRNLRNILEAEVSADHILTVGKRLSSEKAVENSRQLPFRFLAAYRELSKTPSLYATMLMTALERAVQVSAAILPDLMNLPVC